MTVEELIGLLSFVDPNLKVVTRATYQKKDQPIESLLMEPGKLVLIRGYDT